MKLKLEEQERTQINQIKENEKTKVHQEMESFKQLSEMKAVTNETIAKEAKPIDNKSIFEDDISMKKTELDFHFTRFE